MKLVHESNIDGILIRYYYGIDVNSVLNHPKDGSNGMMIVFSDSIESEKIKHKRDSIISEVLTQSINKNKFEDILNTDNSYLVLYQTSGYTDIIFEMVKNKIESKNPYINPWNI